MTQNKNHYFTDCDANCGNKEIETNYTMPEQIPLEYEPLHCGKCVYRPKQKIEFKLYRKRWQHDQPCVWRNEELVRVNYLERKRMRLPVQHLGPREGQKIEDCRCSKLDSK